MDEFPTIQEFADKLDVTKQTVHNHLKKIGVEERTKNSRGIIVLTEEEQIELTKSITGKPPVVEEEPMSDEELSNMIEELRQEIDSLNLKIEEKESQINESNVRNSRQADQIDELNRLLDQQQQLQAVTQKQLNNALEDKTELLEYKEEQESKGFWRRLFNRQAVGFLIIKVNEICLRLQSKA